MNSQERAARRTAIGKTLRFRVLHRDAFTCQYCGRAAPDVVLHIDHQRPISRGGNNHISNLITACEDCNLGKSATDGDALPQIVRIDDLFRVLTMLGWGNIEDIFQRAEKDTEFFVGSLLSAVSDVLSYERHDRNKEIIAKMLAGVDG